MTAHLRNGIQTFMGEAYEAACCALCLIDVAQEYRHSHPERYPDADLDVMAELYAACDKGHIHFNPADLNDNDNFYVRYPALFLEQMTGRKWEYRHAGASYAAREGEYIIQRYERRATGRTIGHFQRDGLFLPIKDSLTVRCGQLVSTRVCRVLS